MEFKLSDSTYKFLKWMTMIALPAMSSLYFGLSGIWDLPNTEQVVGTYSLLIATLGTLLGISTKAYNNSDASFDGFMNVDAGDQKTIYQLELTTDEEALADQKQVVFKVRHTNQVPEGFAE